MAPRADTRRILNAVATLETVADRLEKLAPFTDEADAAAYRHEGRVIALDIREHIQSIEQALADLRKVADAIEKKAAAS